MRVLMAHTQAHTCSGEATTTLVSDSYAHACAMIFVVVPGQKCRRGQKVCFFFVLFLGRHMSHQVAGDLLDFSQIRHVLRFVLHTLWFNEVQN